MSQMGLYTPAVDNLDFMSEIQCFLLVGYLNYGAYSLHCDKERIQICESWLDTLTLAQVKNFPIDLFDGLESFEDLPADGRRVADLIQ